MFRPMSMHSSPMPYMAPRLDHLLAARKSARQDALVPLVGASAHIPYPHPNPHRLRMASTMSTPGWVPTSTLPQAQQQFVAAGEQVFGTFPVIYPGGQRGTVIQGGGPGIAVATPNELIAGGSRNGGSSMATPDALRESVQNSDTGGTVELPDGTVINTESPQIDVPSDADLLGMVDEARDTLRQFTPQVQRAVKDAPPWLLILGVAGVAGGLLFLASR